MVAKIVLISGLLFLFYQDIRYRAVYWMLFPALLAVMAFMAIEQQSLSGLAVSAAYNLSFVLLQLLLVIIYISLRAGKFVNITSAHLGWGDVLFLVCIAFYLSPMNYFLFYILSLILVLLISLALLTRRKAKEFTIPLAGLQALLLAVLMLVDWRLDFMDITTDYWLMKNFYI